MTCSMLAFVMTDILHLRCFAALGTSCAIFFNWQRAPPWNAVVWGLVFVSINVFQIGLLLQERLQTSLSTREQVVYDQIFARHGITPPEFAKLVKLASWRTLAPGERLILEGEPVDSLVLLHAGKVECLVGGRRVDLITGGRGAAEPAWLGELSFLSPTQKQLLAAGTVEEANVVAATGTPVATATCAALPAAEAAAAAAGETVALVWNQRELKAFLEKDASIALAVQASLAAAVVLKLQRKVERQTADDARRRPIALYQELLGVVLCDGVVHPAEKRMLRQYRATHAVTKVEHDELVRSTGWSVAEFDDGAREHVVHDVVPALLAVQERRTASSGISRGA